MKRQVIISINGKRVKARQGQTVLEVARENGIEIPSLCFHPDLEAKASCRLCMIMVKGWALPLTACTTKVQQGMVVTTDSPALRKLRKTNLELLFSQHQEECFDCVASLNCRLLKLAKEYGVKINRFQDRKTNFPVYKFGPSLIFDSSKCIDCGNCVEVCQKQSVGYLELKPFCYPPASSAPTCPAGQARETLSQIMPSHSRECIFCGQCIAHCPAGAFEAVGEFEEIESAFARRRRAKAGKKTALIVQFAPAIRTSICEEFGLATGEIVTEKLVAGIKKLGADKVFDVSVGADFTTTEETKELLAKIKKGNKKPLFSSCCPAWVRFVELYYPEFLPNMATARPPHIILGGLIKTYWAKQQKIDPKNIRVVSIMPCVAKKYEITRKEFLINGVRPVDYVLTTRELARLFQKHNINLKTIAPQKADDPLGIPSGAGVIYGASGGVMESALRTVLSVEGAKLLPARKELSSFLSLRGQKGIKIAKIKMGGKTLKMAAVSGTGNAVKILEELKQNPTAYSCIEVMACPGGCVGGGGQPVWADSEIRKKRAEGLYKIDEKSQIRVATENPIVKRVYKEFLTNKEIIEKVCHARYK